MYTVRQAVPGDSDTRKIILQEATEDLRRVYCPIPGANGKSKTSAHEGRAASSDWVVVNPEGNIHGSFETIRETDCLSLRTVAVLRVARRRGIFRTILAFTRQTARAEGLHRIRVVAIQETGNPTIFQHCGFVVTNTAQSTRYVSSEGRPVNEVTMEFDLSGTYPIRVLFIGNSYTYCNNMPSILADISVTTDYSHRIETGAAAFGGATLQAHWELGEALNVLAKGVWNYVVLQEQSTLPIEHAEKMYQYVRLFDQEIGKRGARTLLYLTWARGDAPETQDILTDAYCSIANEIGAAVVPVGPAWRAAGNHCTLSLYEDDQSHPKLAGSYLAACVFYSVLMGEKPNRLAAGLQGEISSEHALYLGRVAWEVSRQFGFH